MRLVNQRGLSELEREHAYCREEAQDHVRQALVDRQPIEGLETLRAELLINIDSEVLEQLERGEWWLIRDEADFVEWLPPMRAFDPVVLEMMNNPPAQPKRSARIFRLLDSVTGEPLALSPYVATLDGDSAQRRTDELGIAHLFALAEVRRISMKVTGV